MDLRDDDDFDKTDKMFAAFMSVVVVLLGFCGVFIALMIVWGLISAGIVFLTKMLVTFTVIGWLSYKVYPHIKSRIGDW